MVDHLTVESDASKKREQVILDYVRLHQGCSNSGVYRSELVKNQMSYQTFYKILSQLIDQKAIRVEKKNKREHGLFLNENNLLVKASKELDDFEKAYFDLFDKTLIEIRKSPRSIARQQKKLERIGGGKEGDKLTFQVSHEELFFSTLYLFQVMMANYILKMSAVWLGSIADKNFLAKVQNLVLSRITDLFAKLTEKLGEVDEEKHLGLKLNKKLVNDLKEYVIHRFSDMFNPSGSDILYERFDFYNLADDFQKVYYSEALSIK